MLTQDKDEQRYKDAAAANAPAGGDEEAGGCKGEAQDIPPVQGPKGLVGVVLVILQPAPSPHQGGAIWPDCLLGCPTVLPAQPLRYCALQQHVMSAAIAEQQSARE